MAEVTIQLDPAGNQLELFGPADNHLRLLRQGLGVQIAARQSSLIIAGTEQNVHRAAEIIERMQKHLARHGSLTPAEVSSMLDRHKGTEAQRHRGTPAFAGAGPAPAEAGDRESTIPRFRGDKAAPAEAEDRGEGITVYSHKKVVEPSTKGQLKYIEAMLANDITFCIGPAGTGKTYLAVAIGVSMLKKKQTRRIVLARPAVEAGEKLGFLPGDIQAKVNPYLRPLFDALEDMMDFAQMRKFIELDIIEIIPLAFMRGRTLNEAVIICDEAQNTSSLQMLMVLTRLGHGSKMIITGDITQIDLESPAKSGMVEAIGLLKRIKGIGVVELTQKDIVRHRLVQNIVRAYKKKSKIKVQKSK